MFTQAFIRVQVKENIKAPRHWPLWGEFTGVRWIFPHKRPDTLKMFPFYDVIMTRPGLYVLPMSADDLHFVVRAISGHNEGYNIRLGHDDPMASLAIKDLNTVFSRHYLKRRRNFAALPGWNDYVRKLRTSRQILALSYPLILGHG